MILCLIYLLLLVWGNIQNASSAACPHNCSCSSHQGLQPHDLSVFCRSIFPLALPPNTKQVHLQGVGKKEITEDMFAHPSWHNIMDLFIDNSLQTETKLEQRAFHSLQNLRYLKLNSKSLSHINTTSFQGLKKLQTLDLSYSGFYMEDVLNALRGSATLPNLEILDLTTSVDWGRNQLLPLSKDVLLSVFKPKPIKVFNCSGAQIMDIHSEFLPEGFPVLQALNISRAMLFYHRQNDTDTGYTHFLNREVLDISQIQLPLPYFSKTLIMEETTMKLKKIYLNDIKQLYARNIVPFEVRAYKASLTIELTEAWKLEIVNVENNNLLWLNVSIPTVDIFSSIRECYLGYNKMEYINPTLLHQSIKLQIMDFSHNELHIMAAFPEFSTLFSANKHLTNLNLAYNKLKSIPKYMFKANKFLKILDLAHNQLEYITFKVDHLVNLVLLDISNNKLKFLAEPSISSFNSLHQTNGNYTLDFAENPFLCTCENMATFKFFSTSKISVRNLDKTKCTLNGKTELLQEADDKLTDVCKQPMIIALASAISSIMVVLISIFIIIHIYRNVRRNKTRKLKNIIEKFKGLRNKEEFLVFLCYCSEDVEFATNVYTDLENHLKERLKTDQEFVCIGDQHFQAGKPIIMNIIKCVEASKVILLLISRAFCRSHWCEYETLVSYQDRKPIILMFKEEVPRRELPPVVRKLYKTYARAFWKEQSDESVQLVPKWDKICQTILELAGESPDDMDVV